MEEKTNLVLPNPEIMLPVKVIFYLRRWCDPYLSGPKQSVDEVVEKLSSHWRNRREPLNFRRSYNGIHLIDGGIAVVTSIGDLKASMEFFNPRLVVSYPVLFGNYHEGEDHQKLTRMYADIKRNSILTHMPELIDISEKLANRPKIIIVGQHPEGKSSHYLESSMFSVENMVITQLQKRYEKKGRNNIIVMRNRYVETVALNVDGILRAA